MSQNHWWSCDLSVISLLLIYGWWICERNVFLQTLLNTSKAAGVLAIVSGILFTGNARGRSHWLWFSGACLSLLIHDVGLRKEISRNWDWRRRKTNLHCKNPSRLPTSVQVVSLINGTPLNKTNSQPSTDFEAKMIQLLFHTEVRRPDFTNSGMRWIFFH